MDQSKGLEAKSSKEEIRITLMMDLQKISLHLIEISLQGPTSYMRTITRTTEDHTINAQISHSTETTEIDLEKDLSTTRMATGATIEIFLVCRRLKERTCQKITPIANQEVINPISLRSADLAIDL